MITISKNFKRFAGVVLSAALLVTGVVVPKKLQSVDAASNIDLSEIAIGDGSAVALDSYTEYDITGKVRSERSLVSVNCTITKDNGKSMGQVIQTAQWPADDKEAEEQKAGVKKLNLKKTVMNKNVISFKNLEDGKYKLLINAVDKKGFSISKTVLFAIKCDAKSFTMRTFKAAFERDITDREMIDWISVLYTKGAAGLVKEMFKTDELASVSNTTFLTRLYNATFRPRVKPAPGEYDEFQSYMDDLRKNMKRERMVNIFVDNFDFLEKGIQKYSNVELNVNLGK